VKVFKFALSTFPLVLFVCDEGEMLIPSREEAISAFLPYLMCLLDGLVERAYASWGIIITTNRPHVVEPALARPTRLDEFIVLEEIDNPELAFKVFKLWCDKYGVKLPEGVEPSWFSKKTHAECAGVATKLWRMQAFGAQITPETIKELLRESVYWQKVKKVKGTTSERGSGMGFGG